eukprot:s1505_g2.t1
MSWPIQAAHGDYARIIVPPPQRCSDMTEDMFLASPQEAMAASPAPALGDAEKSFESAAFVRVMVRQFCDGYCGKAGGSCSGGSCGYCGYAGRTGRQAE